jgi:hypothetical protein
MNAATNMPAAVETTVGESVPAASLITKPISYKTAPVVTFSAIAPYTSPAPVTAMMSAMGPGACPLPTVTVGTAGDAPTTYKVVSPPAYLETAGPVCATEGSTEEKKIMEPITTTTMAYSAPAPVTYFSGPLGDAGSGETAAIADDGELGYSAPAMTYKPVTYFAAPSNEPKCCEPSPVITYSAVPAQSSVPTVTPTTAITLPEVSEPVTAAPIKQTTYKVAAPVFYSIASAAPLPPKAATSNVIIEAAATTTMGTAVGTLAPTAAAEPLAVAPAAGSVATEPESKDQKQTVAKVVRRKMGCC